MTDVGDGTEIQIPKKRSKKKWISKIIKRIKKYKAIYLTAIIHFSDVITDYLVLCQYVLYAIDQENGYPQGMYVVFGETDMSVSS